MKHRIVERLKRVVGRLKRALDWLLAWVDVAALRWLGFRQDRAFTALGYDQLGFHRAGFNDNKFELTLVDKGDAVFYLASQAAAMLEASNSKNYLEVTMLPRYTRDVPFRPIVLTIRWQDGKSPAVLAGELRRALRKCQAFISACLEQRAVWDSDEAEALLSEVSPLLDVPESHFGEEAKDTT